jgi:hypothetical protein
MGSGSLAGPVAAGGEREKRPAVSRRNSRKYTAERVLQEEHHMAGKPSKGAHVMEQRAGDRSIRPDSEDIGGRELARIPLDQR